MTEVIVIGGGVIGMASALQLHRDGHKVTVLEKGEIGREASWAGGGILSPINPQDYPKSLVDLCLKSAALFPEFVADLEEASGVQTELRRTGLIRVGFADEAGAHYEVGSYLKWHDHEITICSSARACDIEPGLSTDIESALYQPDILQVRNPALLKAMRLTCEVRGITLRPDVACESLLVEGNRVRGVRTAQGDIRSEEVVVAAGAWSGHLLRESIGLDLRIKPMQGIMLLLRGETCPIKAIILGRNRYLIPRIDGHILAGSTIQDRGFDKVVRKDEATKLLEDVTMLVPAIASCKTVQAWAGLRPGTDDRLPFMGRPAGMDGLVVASGHYRNGLCLAPVTGIIVSDLVAGRTPSYEIDTFSLDRASNN